MKVKDLINSLDDKPSESWLQDQYPGRPENRLSEKTFMKFENLQQFLGKESADSMRKFLKSHKDERVAVLLPIGRTGRAGKKPRLLLREDVYYYSHYELFAPAAHLHGFVEIFHNFQKQNKTAGRTAEKVK